MKKLDDIPKKDLFTVPDGYFDKLSSVIQSRISKPKTKYSFSWSNFSLKYALPLILILTVGIFWFRSQESATAETMLASVETEDLIAYLSDSDVSTEELLEQASFDNDDATDIEEAVYGVNLDNETEQELIDEFDLNSL